MGTVVARRTPREFDVNQLSLSYNCIPKGLWQLSQSAVTLYLILLDFQTPHQNEAGDWVFDGVCRLTNKEIKQYTGLGDRMIQTGINDLVQAGILTCYTDDNRRTLEIDHVPFMDMQHQMEERACSWGWNHPVLRNGTRTQYPPSTLTDSEFVAALSDEQVRTACRNILYRGEKLPKALALERQKRVEAEIEEVGDPNQRRSPESTPIGDSARVPLNKINNKTNNTLPSGESCLEVGADLDLGGLLVSNSQGALELPSTEGADRQDLESVPTDLGVLGSEMPKTKAEGKRHKGASKFENDPESASLTNMVEYFGLAYRKTYGRMPAVVLKPQDLAIIKNGFFEKYPRTQLKPIIDTFIQDYSKLPVSKDRYPVPTLRGLTQAWLVELVIQLIANKEQGKKDAEHVQETMSASDNFKRYSLETTSAFKVLLEDLSFAELDVVDKLIASGEMFRMPWYNTAIDKEHVRRELKKYA